MTTITAFSGRRCPNTAYEANCVVAHSTIPQDQDVVDLLARELEPAPREVEVRVDRAVGA